MQEFVTKIMEQFGYIGVFILMALENLFPPIPSEVILLFGGFLTTYTKLTLFGVIITASTGSIIGAIILYGIGKILNITRMEKIVDRWGHVLRLKKEDLHKANKWFEKYGYWTVLFCRMIPIVRSLISIPAGMAGMKFWVFLLFTMIGTGIWNTVLVITGALLGRSWTDILQFLAVYSSVAYILIAIAFLLMFVFFFRRDKN
ncbi:DedA family protein [Pseudogracilibacillus sp. SO30301A]|uniref:DedA family protein n=1 Tax=Pseudogracilibacillus sp. SO30301A TaxID=3098291 RepID=UPI00300E216A